MKTTWMTRIPIKNVRLTACAIDIIDSSMFDGDCFMVCCFFKASDHQQFQENDVETDSAVQVKMRRYMHECVVAKSQAAQEFGVFHHEICGFRGHEKCLDAKAKSSSSRICRIIQDPTH